jgi:hypothetical protein
MRWAPITRGRTLFQQGIGESLHLHAVRAEMLEQEFPRTHPRREKTTSARDAAAHLNIRSDQGSEYGNRDQPDQDKKLNITRGKRWSLPIFHLSPDHIPEYGPRRRPPRHLPEPRLPERRCQTCVHEGGWQLVHYWLGRITFDDPTALSTNMLDGCL